MTNPYATEPPAPQGGWPYGQPPPRARAPFGLSIAAVVLAIALAATELATVLASFPAAEDFRAAVEAGGTTFDVFTAYDAFELLLFPVMLAAYVISCLWLHAARRTTTLLYPQAPHARGPVWVWLGWWVPIVSFWFPYQVVRDIRDNSSTKAVPTVGLGAWWTGWLFYLLCNRVTSRLVSSTDPDTVGMLPAFECIGAVAAVVACVQWCRLVRSITASQEALLAPS